MPWQTDRNAYRVWLSEVMLQQTQVATAATYYRRFLERFPDVVHLAAASQDDVLGLWSGLGYYSRARNLHACAREVVTRFGGRFPESVALLVTLPGIGPSTAAAIAAFCFGAREAIFDGNVKRVAARLAAFNADLSKARNERDLQALVQVSTPTSAADMPAFTQGLMDLGATVCTPRAPKCGVCPFERDCAAFQGAGPQAYPVNSRKLLRKRIDSEWLWLSHQGMTWLQNRPASGLWGGLWSPPTLDGLQLTVLTQRFDWQHRAVRLPTIKHVLTHRDWHLNPVCIEVADEEREALADVPDLMPGRWVAGDEWRRMGIPAAVSAFFKVLSAPLSASEALPGR